MKVHACNKLASRHVRLQLAEARAVPVCDICEKASGAVSSLFSLLWKPCPCSEVKEGHGDVQEGHSLDQLVVACVCKLRDAHFMCFV